MSLGASRSRLKTFLQGDNAVSRRMGQPRLQTRFMEPGDACGVSRLFRKVYGFSYPNAVVYDPGRFSRMVSAGEIVSIVTVTGENRVVGHSALFGEHNGMIKVGMSLVDSGYRHSECHAGMLGLLVDEGRRRGLSGIWSHVVTDHPYAQKTGDRAGFKRVALILGHISAHREYDGVAENRRKAMAYGFLSLADHYDGPLYPPYHHREFIDMIFRNAGLDRRLVQSPGTLHPYGDGQSLIRVRTISADGRAEVEIRRYSPDTLARTESIVRKLLLKQIDQITLFLPLSVPLTAVLCEGFEQMGFFFAGILPRSRIGDALVLQFLHNKIVDYDRIIVASEMLAQIKAYVRCHDPNRA